MAAIYNRVVKFALSLNSLLPILLLQILLDYLLVDDGNSCNMDAF